MPNFQQYQQNYIGYKEIKDKLEEIFPGEAHALDLLDKDFLKTVLNMLKELKESTKNEKKSGKLYMND